MMNFNDDDAPLPPGSPPTKSFEGPWFETQLIISLVIGVVSFLVFSYARTRWTLLFAPRTKLKGFSPHEAHAHQAFFGWILPTIRTSEFTVLQIVGLDAAVLLSFFKMSFYLFSLCSLYSIAILMPINWKHNKDILKNPGEDDDDDNDWPTLTRSFNFDNGYYDVPQTNGTAPPDWLDLISEANTYLSVHLVSVYVFTTLTLFFIRRNYRRFIRTRQLFSLELVHSIPARTVLITDIPPHLRGEKALAEYFESMDLAVESVSLVREVVSLKRLLDRRTKALLKLEKAWCGYVGNPSVVEEYTGPEGPLVDIESQSGLGQGRTRNRQLVVPHRKRPTLRPKWWKPQVDALEYLEREFMDADDMFRKRRRTGKFKATSTAFITFEKMSSAQVAIQTAHYPIPNSLKTYAAPEPRDIVWANMTPTPTALKTRDIIVLGCIGALFFTWIFPVTALASLLSYEEIKKSIPWLGELIARHKKVQALVQNSLPSVAMISLNALLPSLLEALTYIQGYRARSWIEYSLMKKYFLFLLINVVFIFLLASTYWQLVRDLANYPAKIPEKLARALGTGTARHFFLSYVMLQALGIMPLQLLNLGTVIPRVLLRIFVTRTPRDFAELNAPPMINYGVVYPQAILMFVITLVYSVVQPLILIFGALYFGIAYVVYKYKLLFVFYKPYESQGQAWAITFVRCIWGVVIFLLFMTGYFALKSAIITSGLVIPLLGTTLAWSWWSYASFTKLSDFVAISSVFEVERGVESSEVVRLKSGHPVTWSQSNLNRRRYAQNDDTLYVAPEDERTDYSQPPMANWYSGVLNTGKRRYGHPALNGVLPEPWLPLKKGQILVNRPEATNGGAGSAGKGKKNKREENLAVVLTLRKRPSMKNVRARRSIVNTPNVPFPTSSRREDYFAGREEEEEEGEEEEEENVGGEQGQQGKGTPGTGTTNGGENPWRDLPSGSVSSSVDDNGAPRVGRSVTIPSGSRQQQQRPPHSARQPLSRRLSFDAASGVIMLPDEADWMGEEYDDDHDEDDGETDSDEEDYGAPATPTRVVDGHLAIPPGGSGEGILRRTSRLSLGSLPSVALSDGLTRPRVDSASTVGNRRSVAIRVLDEDIVAGSSSAVGGTLGGVVSESPASRRDLSPADEEEPLDSAIPNTPSRTSRYGTYFHHPERRRQSQMIPGAFPR